MTHLNDRIVIDPAIRFGKPIVKGTRVSVDIILGRLAAGLTYDDVIREYQITKDDILAVLQYAAEYTAHEELLIS